MGGILGLNDKLTQNRFCDLAKAATVLNIVLGMYGGVHDSHRTTKWASKKLGLWETPMAFEG